MSVSNCKFRGPNTSLTTLPYRGWIFFSPTFSGQNSSVTDCQFIGDTEGDIFNPASVPRYRTASAKAGVGVVSYTSEVVLISDCMFHSLSEGVRCIAGKTLVNDSSFLVCPTGVKIGNPPSTIENFGYSLVDATWVPPISSVNFISEVSGCSFSSTSTRPDRGIRVLPQQEYTLGSVNITECKFFEILLMVLDYQLIGTYTLPLATVPVNYRSFRICNSTFDSIYSACVDGASVGSSPTLSSPSNRTWAIQSFDYIGNIHNTLQLSQTGEAVIAISGRYCTIKNNEVAGAVFNTLSSNIFNLRSIDTLFFENNTILECYTTSAIPAPASNYSIMLSIHVSSAYPSLFIKNNNMVIGGGAGSRGINNGIEVNTITTTNADITVDLELSDNNIELKNANYVLLSVQDSSATTYTQVYVEARRYRE